MCNECTSPCAVRAIVETNGVTYMLWCWHWRVCIRCIRCTRMFLCAHAVRPVRVVGQATSKPPPYRVHSSSSPWKLYFLGAEAALAFTAPFDQSCRDGEGEGDAARARKARSALSTYLIITTRLMKVFLWRRAQPSATISRRGREPLTCTQPRFTCCGCGWVSYAI